LPVCTELRSVITFTMTLDASAIALSVAAGAAAGLMGCFAVMRRMTLAADAISHIALPGIGVAILLHIHPILGGVAALIVGTLLVWGIENTTRLATETIIGVVFSTALAIGSLITSGDELIEALFGGVGRLTTLEAMVGIVVASGVIGFVLWQRHRLVLTLVSPEIAHTSGINVPRLNLYFLLVFAVTIALGLRYLGVLLVGSLVIIPAATAKRLAGSLRGMLLISVAVSIASTTLGTWLSLATHRPPGSMIVLVAASFFVLSLLLRLVTPVAAQHGSVSPGVDPGGQ
jgi:ABC-type Mn2+/Zn2+ transport system permease subunit